MVSNPSNEMSHFLTRGSDELVEECYSAMLYYKMDISHLMIHAQQVEKSRLMRKNREEKKSKIL